MKNITRTYFSDRAEFFAIRDRFHAERRLGGSDIGTAAGQNKYKSRRRLYAELTGAIAIPDISGKQAIKDGLLCEDLVAMKFCERTGKKVHRENCVMTASDCPHLFASIDRKVENESAGLECKTANAFNHDAFTDGRLPDSYVKQVKSYLKVTGYTRWYVYVWVMGVAEYCYIFTTDHSELENPPEWADAVYFVSSMELDECEDIAASFAQMLESNTPPPCDGSDDEVALIKELYPVSEENKVVASLDIEEAEIAELEERKAAIKEHERAIACIENRIKEALGTATEGMVGSRKITWKNNKPSLRTDWRAAGAELPSDVIARYTTEVPGARVLRIGKAKS